MANYSDTLLSPRASTQYSKGSDFGAELVVGCVHSLCVVPRKAFLNGLKLYKIFRRKKKFHLPQLCTSAGKTLQSHTWNLCVKCWYTNNQQHKVLRSYLRWKIRRWTPPHTHHLCKVCLTKLNLTKTPSHSIFRADRSTQLQIYRALIISKRSYRAAIHASAIDSYLSHSTSPSH